MELIQVILLHPIAATGYFFLILSMISMWVHKKMWIWLPLLILSLVFAYFGDIITEYAFVPILVLFACYFACSQEIRGFLRLFAAMIAAIITFGMYTHYVKGFQNILLLNHWQSTAETVPINIYLNYDKGIVPILILGLYLSLIDTKGVLKKVALITLPCTIVIVLIALGLSHFLGMVKFDPKFPLITLSWLLIQTFFVVIPEEVFYRGFLQTEIVRGLGDRASGILGVLASSLLFTSAHIFFVFEYKYLLLVFVMSLLFGGLFQITKKIESSIFAHLTLNILHFFFFSYPMLIQAH